MSAQLNVVWRRQVTAVSERTFAQRLARLRVTLGFVFGGLVLWLAEPTGATLVAGTAIAAVGEALRIWAAGHLNKAREVTASGPYRWLAHPLYVGSSIMGIGLAVVSASPLVVGLIALYLVVTMTAAIKSEEAFLRDRFGDRYARYRAADREQGARGASAPRQAMANREYRALVGLGLAVLLLALKATYNGLFWRAAGSHPSVGAVSSVVEHRLYTPAATGSNPVPPTRANEISEGRVQISD